MVRAWIEPGGDEVPTPFDKIEVYTVNEDDVLGDYTYVEVASPLKWVLESDPQDIDQSEERLFEKMHESAWETGLNIVTELNEQPLDKSVAVSQVSLSGEDKDLLLALYFNSRRVLDALYVLLGPEKSKKLQEIHEAGEFLSIDPFVDQDSDDD
jgi:hypothetical protein